MLAQTNTAELAGSIIDQSGGAVPKVHVFLTSPATGIKRSAYTDGQGVYRFLRLAPGAYEVTASMDGFQTERRPGIVLTVGQQATLNLTLMVGSVEVETVVSSGAPLIDLQNAALSDVMDPKAIRELPLNGRDFAQLALLEPGVAPSRRSSGWAIASRAWRRGKTPWSR